MMVASYRITLCVQYGSAEQKRFNILISSIFYRIASSDLQAHINTLILTAENVSKFDPKIFDKDLNL